jgi:hypothetical protein
MTAINAINAVNESTPNEKNQEGNREGFNKISGIGRNYIGNGPGLFNRGY